MGTILREIRMGLRQMRKAPGFAIVAILTLALGIGANTAVFTLLDQALLRRLPVSHPEQLVRLRFTGTSPGHIDSYGGDDKDYFSYPMYRDLRDKNGVFDGILASDQCQAGVQWNNSPELANCEMVSGNYFQVLGVQPAAGRVIVPSDDVPNSAPVAVLSFNYWKTKFGGDLRVVNQTLLIDGHPFTIIGIATPAFHSVVAGQTPKIFVPITAQPMIQQGLQGLQGVQVLEDHKSRWLTLAARLIPGETAATAEAGINPLWTGLRAEEFPLFNKTSEHFRQAFFDKAHLMVVDGSKGFSPLRDQVGEPLLIVMGMVGLVILMACVNISSLLLVRASGRAREMSVRYAMGASRWQIIRQLLVEGLLLGTLGGIVGVIVAPLATRALVRAVVVGDISHFPFSTGVDLRILLFNFAIAFAASVLCSLAPALRFLKPDLVTSLKQQTGTSGASPLIFRRITVGLQIGLSLLLVIGAGLFVRTLRNLESQDVGFVTGHLVTFGINPQLAGYQQNQVNPLHKRVLDTLAALPGIVSIGGTDDPELSDDDTASTFSIAGYDAKDEEDMTMEMPSVTPGYFAALQIPLLAGRTLTDHDIPGQPSVAVVNATFARKYFGNPQQALGHMVGRGSGSDTKVDIEIVGVVGDAKHSGVRDDIRRTIYRPFFQNDKSGTLQYYVRTVQSPESAEANIRAALQNLDSKLVLDTMRTMDEQIDDNLMNDRLVTLLAVIFAVLATSLAAIGLYGVLAYTTAQRTREIGIRMAMGAQRISVVRMVLVDVMWLAGISIALTIPLALLLTRMVRSQLYGVSAFDPFTLLAGTVLVSLVALLAALLPARRAASVEPMKALRTE
jgi:putative ABC transport system permease protein